MTAAPALFALTHTVVIAFARHAGAAVVSSLWEGILLAAATGVCLSLFPRITARLRFTIWIAAFLILTALPVLSAVLAVDFASASKVATVPHLQLDSRWSYALAALWLAAVLVRAAHLAVQAIELRRLWKLAVPVSSVGALGVPCLAKVPVCISTELDRPSVIGFLAPRILIPSWLFDQLSPAELRHIVLHEVEHLRRGDDWMNLLQKIGLVLFPLNPALFWIDRRLDTERELACDDGVLCRTQAPRAYAACLTSIAERCLNHRRYSRLTALALGAVGAIRRSELSRRIEGILGFSRRSSMAPSLARAFAAFLVAALFASAAALTHLPQLVSFTAAAPSPVTLSHSAPVISLTPQPSPARFESVVFHPPQPAAGNQPVLRRATRFQARPARISSGLPAVTTTHTASKRADNRWLLLTSWQHSTAQPMLVTMPDGRIFLATYAEPNAGMYQGGWLLLQL